MIAWIPGAAPSMAGNASTIAASPSRQSFGATAAAMPSTRRSRSATASGSPPFSTSTSSGFSTPGVIPAAVRASRPTIASPRAGDVLQLGLVRIQLEAVEDEHAGDREPDRRNRYRPHVDESRPATPRPVLGVTAIDEPLRQQPHAVDSLAEHRQQRREQRDRREHRHRRDQHSADADRADERHGQHDQGEQPDRPPSSPRRSPPCPHASSSRRAPSPRPRPRAARRGSGRSGAARSRSRRRGRRARSGTGRRSRRR